MDNPTLLRGHHWTPRQEALRRYNALSSVKWRDALLADSALVPPTSHFPPLSSSGLRGRRRVWASDPWWHGGTLVLISIPSTYLATLA